MARKTKEYRQRKAQKSKEWREALTPEEAEAFRQRKNASMRQGRRDRKELYMWRAAKKRAIAQGLPFNIEVDDIKIPTHCPVLGIELKVSDSGRQGPSSPSLDRIKPHWGYVKGNIIVVSFRVNQIKRDATLAEIAAIHRFYSL